MKRLRTARPPTRPIIRLSRQVTGLIVSASNVRLFTMTFQILPIRKASGRAYPGSAVMSIPVMEGDKVRIIFGVGNKTEEYDEHDVVQLQLVANDLQNIIKQRRSEEALRESEERYRSLIENINLGITLIGTDYRIIMTNTGQAKLFNKPASAFRGKQCFREFEKRSEVCPHCPGTIAMATGRTAEAETTGIRDDGSNSQPNPCLPYFWPERGNQRVY